MEGCDFICVDGIGVKIALLLRGFSVKRYHGPDLLADLISAGKAQDFSLIGGNPALTEKDTRGILRSRVQLPMSEDVNRLATSASDELLKTPGAAQKILISLGLPKQELVAGLLIKELAVHGIDPVVIPLGAAIDFQFGYKRRSSKLWQNLGLEWLPRVIREPRMLPRLFRSVAGLVLLAFNR